MPCWLGSGSDGSRLVMNSAYLLMGIAVIWIVIMEIVIMEIVIIVIVIMVIVTISATHSKQGVVGSL